MQDKNEIIKNAMRHMGKPIDEITRRMTHIVQDRPESSPRPASS